MRVRASFVEKQQGGAVRSPRPAGVAAHKQLVTKAATPFFLLPLALCLSGAVTWLCRCSLGHSTADCVYRRCGRYKKVVVFFVFVRLLCPSFFFLFFFCHRRNIGKPAPCRSHPSTFCQLSPSRTADKAAGPTESAAPNLPRLGARRGSKSSRRRVEFSERVAGPRAIDFSLGWMHAGASGVTSGGSASHPLDTVWGWRAREDTRTTLCDLACVRGGWRESS